jgi:CHRD domain
MFYPPAQVEECSMRLRYVVTLAILGALSLGAVAAHADTGFSATLAFANEVASPCVGSFPGSGTGTFVLNNAQTELSFNISFSGLSSTESAAHFHNAAVGVNGGVIRHLPFPANPQIGVWRSTDSGSTNQPLTPFLVGELLAARLYANIHSSNCPQGELRGQVVLDATPTLQDRSWGRIKALYR